MGTVQNLKKGKRKKDTVFTSLVDPTNGQTYRGTNGQVENMPPPANLAWSRHRPTFKITSLL